MFGKELRLDVETTLSGLFLAQVVDNKDPKAMERVKVRVLGVHNMENDIPENSIWASHIAPSKLTTGEIPEVGDWLYVMFIQNDPMSCVWLGWVRYIQGD